jgi:hypothetical protein
MKTLKEYLDDMRNAATPEEKFTPSSLSPMHFSPKDKFDAEIYKDGFDEFLRYYGKDPRRAEFFGNMLHDALVNRNIHKLKSWHNAHKI